MIKLAKHQFDRVLLWSFAVEYCLLAPMIALVNPRPRFNPEAERTFLRTLPAKEAAQVAGSVEKRQRILKDKETLAGIYNEGKDELYQWKRVGDVGQTTPATATKTEDDVSNAYEVAKAEGAPHHGWLKQYEKLPDHLIQKSIRSIQKRIQEHEAWIQNPALKLGDVNQVDPRALSDYIHHKWPSDIQRQKEQLSILQGILEARS